jgi:FkbM family methyltransferase
MTAKAKQGSQALAIGGKTARQARVQGIDQIWIINLDRRRDRLERFMQAHPEMLGRINRLPAYDGKTLELTPDIARLFAPNNFDWHKPTMGCALSHLALWQKLADDPDDHAAYLILEDDARLAPSWVTSVERAFHSNHVPGDWEVLFLGGILPKYREFFDKNIALVNGSIAKIKPDCKFGNNPPGYFHFCAYSYLLNKRGAQRLLDLVASGGGVWMQADFLACYTTPDLQPARPVYFLNPLPAHSFQDAEAGLARPYSESGEAEKVDSDIWKKDNRFPEKEISCLLDRSRKLDIYAALGMHPAETSSMDPSAPENFADASGDSSRPVHRAVAGVDKIWLINLRRRLDRLEKFKSSHPEIARRIRVLDAYDGRTLKLTPKIARLFSPNEFGWNKAIMGCSLSHLELWQQLANEPDENARYLILEDDVKLEPDWRKNLEQVFLRGDLPDEWDVLYLGGVLPKYKGIFSQCKEQVSGMIYRVSPNAWFGQNPPNRYFHFGAFAYLLSRRGAKKLLEFIRLQNGIWPQADVLLAYVTPENYPVHVEHYFFDPPLAGCYQDFEDGYVKSYAEGDVAGKLDSDIWKESTSFDENLAREMISLAVPYDIPGALAEARRQTSPYSHATTAKTSLLHATRGRPEQASEARKLWLQKANNPERVEHIFALDHDDESSKSLKKFHHVMQTHDGYSVGAWNLAAQSSTGDILVQMSDDWDPPVGWDDLIAGSLDISLERVLWVNEDYTRKDIMCMAILTRKYYKKHGLFDHRFKNVYSDDDFTARAKKLSAITHAKHIVFKHKHFTTGDSPIDATYQRCNNHEEYHRAHSLFESIHNAMVVDGGDILAKDNRTFASSAVFVGCAKNCGAYLPTVLRNIERIASLFSEAAFVFVENDSTDGTKRSLRDWVANRDKAVLLELDGLTELKPLRTDRMASARNAYLEHIRSTPLKHYDYLLVFDFDHVNSGVLSLEQFRKAIHFLDNTPEAAGVLPVSDPVYYDIWALRHPELSPDDCWKKIREQHNTIGLREATERFVYSRQQSIDARGNPIPVVSAFGGLGIYRQQYALASEYTGTTAEGEEACEHVKFSEIMTARSGRHLYIFPQLRNWAPPEHQRPMEVAIRKICLEQDGAKCEILAPQEHPLDRYRQTNPLYDRRLPLLARLMQEKSPDGTVIDIGANIGDTIALLRVSGVRNPIVALEPSPKFFAVLKRNIETQPSLFGQVQALHAFAGDTTHTLRLEGGTGTASSQRVQLESPDCQPMCAPTIPLQNLGIRDISIVKVDTDGYDASILRSEMPYITRALPIIWAEADIRSAQQHGEWHSLLQETSSIFEWVCAFDNFGFLIAHGRLGDLRLTISELLRYTYRHALLPANRFGQPRIHYLDLVFFPSRWSNVYSAFIESLPEASE